MHKKIKCRLYLIFIFLIKNIIINTNDIFNIRKLEKNTKFLNSEIFEAENNKLIKDFMSTKYIYWNKGYKGQNIKIGILDSGINNNISKCKNLKKIKNFSDENIENDTEGHGTYLSSIICGETYGISPNSEIFIYKIFTGNGYTNTHWIIEALNEAIFIDKCKIINLSFGGINYNDKKLINLIKIATNNNILIIASAGNEGPSYGTISFPGTLPYLLTVGSLSKEIFSIYKYSSRGPAMLDKNTLITKPNLFAPGENIIGLSFDKINDKTKNIPIKIFKNGSSIATAIVTGFVSLCLSVEIENLEKWNIAKLINIIQNTNIFLPELNNEYEKFSGLFNPQGLLGYILNNNFTNKNNNYNVHIYNYDYSFNSKNNKEKINPQLNFPDEILYSTKQPKEISLLILNELDNKNFENIKLPFQIKDIIILQSTKKNSKKRNKKYNKMLSINDNCVKFELISDEKNITRVMLSKLKIIPDNEDKCTYYQGDVEIKIIITDNSKNQLFNFFYSYHFEPKPLKLNRILFDRGHNLIYPYDDKNVIKDNLLSDSFDYDWTYESISTNFKGLGDYLSNDLNSISEFNNNYYIEETTQNLNLINLSLYSVLIIIDPEKNFSDEEITSMQNELEKKDLGILIVAEWNNESISKKFNKNHKIKKNENNDFYGGGNISNLNKFLLKYNIALSQNSISGDVYLLNKLIHVNSGTSISLFPQGGLLFGGYFTNDEMFLINPEEKTIINKNNEKENNITNLNNNNDKNNNGNNNKIYRAILGILDNAMINDENLGRLAIFTDSYCIDDYQLKNKIKNNNCFWLIKYIVQFLIHGLYTENEFNLQNKKRLYKNYYNNENIFIDSENNTKKIVDINLNEEFLTNEIPNLFELEMRKQINLTSSKHLLEIIKGVLVVFMSIFFILVIMLFIIKLKEDSYRRMKYNAIKTLEEIKPLSLRIIEKKYKMEHATAISSEDYFYFMEMQETQLP